MATIASLNVLLNLDDQFSDKLGGVQRKLDSWGKNLRTVGTGITAGVTMPIIGAAGAAINWASDLDETMSKTNKIFEGAEGSVMSWSESSVEALVMTQNEALTFASSYGGMLSKIAEGPDELANMSMALTDLTADFGSFHNLSNEEAFTVISSALAGETEAIRRYGVDVSAAAVETKALEMGLAETTAELTEQDKALARYNIIMDDTAVLQGDLDDTSGSFSNTMKRLRARIKQTATEMGRALVPYATKLLDVIDGLVEKFNGLSPSMQKTIMIVAGLAAVIGPLLIALGFMLPALGAIGAAIAFLVSPIGLVVIAIAALAAGFIYAYTHFDGFREIVDKVAGAVKDFATGALDLLIAGFTALKEAFDADGWSGVWDALLNGATTALQAIGNALLGLIQGAATWLAEGAVSLLAAGIAWIQGLWDGAVGKWNEFTGWLGGLASSAATWIGDTAVWLLQKGLDFIQGLWNGATTKWDEFTGWVSGLMAGVGAWVGDVTETLTQKGTDLIAGLYIAATTKWYEMVDWIMAIPEAVVAYVGDVTATLTQKGKDFITGLWNGALELWKSMSAWVKTVPSLVTSTVGNVASTLAQKGRDLMTGLWSGILEGWASVSGWLSGLPGLVAGAIGDMAGALVGAGQAVMDGFLAGMQAGWDTVTGWLGTLNPANYKGPEERDRKMLYEPGIWIMEGLSRGLNEGWGDVTRQLSGYNPAIGDAVMATTGSHANGAGAGGVHHHYYSVTPDDLKRLIENANAGGQFARQFGGELAMMGGTP